MAEASKVSGEKYRRTFPEYDPVFAVRLEIFFEISFPWEIGNNCSCIYLSGNSADFTFLPEACWNNFRASFWISR